MSPKDQVIGMKAEKLLNPSVASLFLNETMLKSSNLRDLKALKDWVQLSVNKDHLDDKLSTSAGLHDHETEMELEQEREQEMEKEVENEIEQQMEQESQKYTIDRTQANHQPDVIRKILGNHTVASIPLQQWIGRHRVETNIFNPMIKVSQNQFNSYQEQVLGIEKIETIDQLIELVDHFKQGSLRFSSPGDGRDHPSDEVERSFKPVEYVLIHVTNKGQKKSYELTLIDTNDANDVMKEFQTLNKQIDSTNEGWVLYALGAGQVHHVGLGVEGEPGHEDQELLSLLVQAKFADGEIYYNEDEQKVLRDWIEEVGVDKVESEIKYILRDQPSRRDAYAQSSLGTIIKSIKRKKS